MGNEKSLDEIKEIIRLFCEERDWNQFHNAKDLATGLSIESSELLEHFLWKNKEEVEEMFSGGKREEIEDELADVFYYVVRIAERYGICLTEVLERKIEKNRKKYPIEKCRGRCEKYNEL